MNNDRRIGRMAALAAIAGFILFAACAPSDKEPGPAPTPAPALSSPTLTPTPSPSPSPTPTPTPPPDTSDSQSPPETGSSLSPSGGSSAAPVIPIVLSANYEMRWEPREFKEQSGTCFECHATFEGEELLPVELHTQSAHYRAGMNCEDCHGGDPTSDLEFESHDQLTAGWAGPYEFDIMMERCEGCHQAEAEMFYESRHAQPHEGLEDLSCVDCHGHHNIGAGVRGVNESWEAVCSACHLQDDVPDLHEGMMRMLRAKDALDEAMRDLRIQIDNQPFDPSVMDPLREVRQRSSDIVHTNNVDVGEDELNDIIEKTLALEQFVRSLLPR
jgi:hypothetical protein